MPFILDSDLTAAVASVLKLANPASLPASWAGPITEANAMAYSDILGALMDRGFTQAQIDGWNRGATIQRLQGLYWAFVIGAGIHNFDDRWANKWDQRTYLKTCLVELAGGPGQFPAIDPGLVEVGTFNVQQDIPVRAYDGRLISSTQDRWDEKNFPM